MSEVTACRGEEELAAQVWGRGDEMRVQVVFHHPAASPAEQGARGPFRWELSPGARSYQLCAGTQGVK